MFFYEGHKNVRWLHTSNNPFGMNMLLFVLPYSYDIASCPLWAPQLCIQSICRSDYIRIQGLLFPLNSCNACMLAIIMLVCHVHSSHFNTSKAHPAKTRTFKSTLLVAMTHLIFPPPPLSSFFTMPLTNPLESPFDVGPIGTSGAHRMLLTKCP